MTDISFMDSHSPSPGFYPGLLAIHANQAEDLRDVLVSWMGSYPVLPLEREVVIAQSNGVAQWLKFALATPAEMETKPGQEEYGQAHIQSHALSPGLGIAAGIDMTLPARFLWRAYRCILGADAVPETSSFDKPQLTWRLMRILPEVINQPDFEPLKRFLVNDLDCRRRLQLSEKLADLYDQYQVYRADWLMAWANGDDILLDANGGSQPLNENRWQAALWRSLVADVAEQFALVDSSAVGGRAGVHQAFLERAAHLDPQTRPKGLPRRITVFGISSLPQQTLEVLSVVSRWSQVFLCLQNPCQFYWGDIIEDRHFVGVHNHARQARHERRPGAPSVIMAETLHQHAHPLLAAWGKQGRDFINLLSKFDDPENAERWRNKLESLGQKIDLFRSPGRDTILRQIQDDILNLRPISETQQTWPAVDSHVDHSLRFHIAHSPQREVEVLHDQLLFAFKKDPTLQPRDCIVMVPDIEVYAPHIQAVFGLHSKDEVRTIPFAVADQNARQQDPILRAAEFLTNLGQSRLGVSEILDLLEVPALRRKFGISEVDVPVLHRWIVNANIRWGLDDAHVASFGLPDDQPLRHTWAHGLRRMLLGYAVGDTHNQNEETGTDWNDIEPQAEAGGLEAALIGNLDELVCALEELWLHQQQSLNVEEWVESWRGWLGTFFLAETQAEQAAILSLESALRDWLEQSQAAEFSDSLPASVVGECWLSHIDQPGLSQPFFAGSVTFATLLPMRSIPFRFVALLGMNDGDYPRARPALDFDLMSNNERPGDRSRREDDRYLFLEALLSARECLHCFWIGRSVTDNTERPPSVLVGQLRDHIEAGWQHVESAFSDVKSVLDAITIEHPLQPFSTRYQTDSTQRENESLCTYATEWQPNNQAHEHPKPQTPIFSNPLPSQTHDELISLNTLSRFLKDPVKSFFRERLDVVLERWVDDVIDEETFALDGLQSWQIRQQLFQLFDSSDIRSETIPQQLRSEIERMRRRGDFPAGGVGDAQAEEIFVAVHDLGRRRNEILEEWHAQESSQWLLYRAESVSVGVEDTLAGLYRHASDDGECLQLIIEPSDLYKQSARPEKLLNSWVSHIFANALAGSTTTRVLSASGEAVFDSMQSNEAGELLSDLLDVWQSSQNHPLPIAPSTAFTWLKKRSDAAAARVYEGDSFQPGEVAASPYRRRVFPDYAELVSDSAFYALAERIYGPIFSAAKIETPKT
ncbi:MAG: exodeoxyribonuclease V subunit gamma [Spiribacter sp.]|nr:exodeoxyribonuclease V subunit gamma [Spiribacter sp.]MDR9489885.1 exodeoxyribonuclease V subunit gamma [Spiribacter sp.]